MKKMSKEEKYRFLGGWGIREDVGKIVIKVEDINTHEFRGHFEGEEFNYVFQNKDVKHIADKMPKQIKIRMEHAKKLRIPFSAYKEAYDRGYRDSREDCSFELENVSKC